MLVQTQLDNDHAGLAIMSGDKKQAGRKGWLIGVENLKG
jgi:hypothetical protein